MNIFSELENFITTTAWPFIKNIGKTVVKAETAALQPIAVKLVAGAESAIVSAAASGSLSQLGTVLGKLVTDTAVEAEGASISAGATSLFTSLGTALASNPTTATSLAPAAPVAVVAATLAAPAP